MKTMNGIAKLAGVMIFGLVPLLAQTGKSGVPDALKARQELETMVAIIETSLRYAVQDMPESEDLPQLLQGGVKGYYVPGQGALFMIPVIGENSPLHYMQLGALEGHLAAAEAQQYATELALEQLEGQLETAAKSLTDAQRLALERANRELLEEPAPPPPAPPSPPTAPAPPAPPERLRVEQVAPVVAEKLRDARKRLARDREEWEKRSLTLKATLDRLSESLVETLSKHGDSLSFLPPDESITFIVTREGSGLARLGMSWRQSRPADEPSARVLSVKKSDVTALKAARIDRAEFRRRLVDHEM